MFLILLYDAVSVVEAIEPAESNPLKKISRN
jgi:hypothetical protein